MPNSITPPSRVSASKILRVTNYWSARKLAKVLEYSEYRHFQPVIERAWEACQGSGYAAADHFEDILEMVDIGSGAKRELPDVRLSRYACYLIVQNGDPSKPVIANGQTYFAMQTRRQELRDNEKFARLSEDEKRLAIRNELAEHNKYLAAAAKDAGASCCRCRRCIGRSAKRGGPVDSNRNMDSNRNLSISWCQCRITLRTESGSKK